MTCNRHDVMNIMWCKSQMAKYYWTYFEHQGALRCNQLWQWLEEDCCKPVLGVGISSFCTETWRERFQKEVWSLIQVVVSQGSLFFFYQGLHSTVSQTWILFSKFCSEWKGSHFPWNTDLAPAEIRESLDIMTSISHVVVCVQRSSVSSAMWSVRTAKSLRRRLTPSCQERWRKRRPLHNSKRNLPMICWQTCETHVSDAWRVLLSGNFFSYSQVFGRSVSSPACGGTSFPATHNTELSYSWIWARSPR